MTEYFCRARRVLLTVVACSPRVVDVDERAYGKYAPDSASFSGFEVSAVGDSTGLGSSSCSDGA